MKWKNHFIQYSSQLHLNYYVFLELIAYRDLNGCGPFDDDNNWQWCENHQDSSTSNMACEKQVPTDHCDGGIAYLKAVHYQYSLYGCDFKYFSEYVCIKTGTLYSEQ